jgi:hypothetical protein
MRLALASIGTLLGLAFAGACVARRGEPVVAVALVDVFDEGTVRERRPLVTPPRTEWSFAALAPHLSWAAGPGVAGLELRDGALVGTSAGERPVVELRA